MAKKKRILAVVGDRNLYLKLEKLMNREAFEVNRVPSGAGALVLTGNLQYDLILLEAPLPDLGLQQFLSAIRTLESPCAASAILVLARDEHVGPLAIALDGDFVETISSSADEAQMQKAVTAVLGVAARIGSRVLVEIEVVLEGVTSRKVCQTENFSETGVLLRSTMPPEIGSRLRLSFSLPSDARPIVADGQVVRFTDPERETTRGMAVRFLCFEEDGRERLREFVQLDIGRRGPGSEVSAGGEASAAAR